MASKQCGRDIIPTVRNITSLKEVATQINNYDIMLLAYENENENFLKDIIKNIKLENKEINIGIIIGPEGGIEEKEVELLENAGAKVISLGKRILRTETVAMVLTSIIMYELGDIGGQTMEEIFEEDLSKNKKLTPELKSKIRKTFGKNLAMIGLVLVYMGLITLAFYKMELNTLATDLKVIGTGFLVVSIIKFEQGYKKDNEGIFLVGVEFLVLALISLFMTALISEEEALFRNVVTGISVFSVIYYLLKSCIIRMKIKKQHKKQISDIRDIVKKEKK